MLRPAIRIGAGEEFGFHVTLIPNQELLADDLVGTLALVVSAYVSSSSAESWHEEDLLPLAQRRSVPFLVSR
jgi:hypothetical protein